MIQQGNGKSHVRPAAATRLPPVSTAPPQQGAWRERMETCISDHPLLCLAAAVTLGAIAGWFIKRR